jgi:uncharacterized damage-inducible protein DinB
MKWFERNFDFSFDTSMADTVCHRLRHAPARLQLLIAGTTEEDLNFKPNNKWSIKEQVGHLTILEGLWRARLNDFNEGKTELTPADLDNKATDAANFNQYHATALLDQFLKERTATLALISTIDIRDVKQTSLHPRLKSPMRIVDHLFFVAEHDDHHYTSIHEIITQLKM